MAYFASNRGAFRRKTDHCVAGNRLIQFALFEKMTFGSAFINRSAAGNRGYPAQRRTAGAIVATRLPPDLRINIEHYFFGKGSIVQNAKNQTKDEAIGAVV